MPSKRPTQADVARLAQVSRATVSLVLNSQNGGRIPISEATRQRVLRSSRPLGYAPNAAAQMLARGRNQLVGVFTYEPQFPYETEDFYYPFLLGIEREASRQDHDVLLFTRNRSGGPRRIYRGGTNALRLADGAILLGAYPDRDELRRLFEESYPFVYIGRREVPGCEIDWVSSDYTSASRQAISHVIGLGHRRLAFIGDCTDTESYRDRLVGCHLAVGEAEGVELVVLPEAALSEPGLLAELLRQTGATALISKDVKNLHAALGLIRDVPIRVPDDLSVLSLADGESNALPPLRLTQVLLNRQRVGELALRALMSRLNGTATGPQQIRVPCEVVPGDSTVAPHGATRMPEASAILS